MVPSQTRLDATSPAAKDERRATMSARPDSPRRISPGRILVAGAITLALVGGAVGASSLLSYAEDHYRVANAAADVHTEIIQSSDLSGDIAASVGPPSAALVTDATKVRDQLLADIETLRRSGFDARDVVSLDNEVHAYVASEDHLVQLSMQGRTQDAKSLDTQNDVTATDLAARTSEEVGELRDLADRGAQLASDGILLLAALVVLAVVGALLWDGRGRRRVAEARAKAEGQVRFEAMVEQGSDLLVLTDSAGMQTYASPALEHLLGYGRDAPAAQHLAELASSDDRSILRDLLAQALRSSKAGPADLRLRHADGSTRTMEVNVVDLHGVREVGAVLWSAHDVTDRRQLEAELERSSFEDALTGLANRAMFGDRVEQALSRAARTGHTTAVLLADLDGFKAVNDSLGHEVGDTVLVEMAARLTSCARPGDTVGRMGGDEFAILLEDLADIRLAQTVADQVVEIVRQPMRVADTEIRLGVSIGIARSVAGGDTAQAMVRNADVAMYAAKSQGRGCWAHYDADVHAHAEEQRQLSAALDGALERHELEVYYQPTLTLATGEVEGTEALLRWHHPQLGLLQPATFIPLAEQSGQIVPIGRWVLEQACLQARTWQTRFPSLRPRNMCVNLSGRQFADPTLVADIASILRATLVDPQTIVLEITETVVMCDVDMVTTRLHELKDLGVRLAIDDFGTGYSSLAYLREFPVDILKIDRSFVEAASSGAAGGEALVRAIVDLAAGLHLATIAEGIEHQDQADFLMSLGCTTGQGYLFARPMPSAALARLLARIPSAAVAAVPA
jgi:diguanylate cyclase (GGDEF)-like protein/PAS domain S-box-containing protein